MNHFFRRWYADEMKFGILDGLQIVKSEQWRWQWAFRTAISISCISFLALYTPTRDLLTHHGKHKSGPAFAALVTGMAKDRMLGGTLIHSWHFILSCFLSCLFCWVIVVAKNDANGKDGKIPDGVILVLIFVITLFLKVMDIPPAGKKFACAIIPILLLSVNNGLQPDDMWYYLLDSVIGAGCAIVGNVIPLPIESSTVALQKRLCFCAHSSTALLTDIFQAWQYQSCFSDETLPSADHDALLRSLQEEGTDELSLLDRSRLLALRKLSAAPHGRARSSPKKKSKARRAAKRAIERVMSYRSDRGDTESNLTLGELNARTIELSRLNDPEFDQAGPASPQQQHKRHENRHWRKLRLLVTSLAHLKHSKGTGLGWYFSNNSCGTKFLRVELNAYLHEGLAEVSARVAESQFASIDPLRRYFSWKYKRYASVLRDALSIATILEQKIVAMEEAPELNYIYRAFHNMPPFRSALSEYVAALCRAVESIADCLAACDNKRVHPCWDRNPYILQCMRCTAILLKRQALFDETYLQCRRTAYYELIENHPDLYHTRETKDDMHGHPMESDVLMNMNSFLFLTNALCTIVVEYWTPEELEAVRVNTRTDVAAQGSEQALAQKAWEKVVRPWWPGYLNPKDLREQVPKALRELFPSQKKAFAGFLPFASVEDRHHARMHLRAGLSLAVSMTLASAYGLYLDRPQSYIAPFTIAFLAGGSAAGATMVTSLNRAAGTVVACVWAIIVQLVLNNLGSEHGHSSSFVLTTEQQLIIGIAVVLLQFPATIVRSYPLHGYAGTCASYTICNILFAPYRDESHSTARIIDTFVGVAIYLGVESVLSTAHTEDVLLSAMKTVFEGIYERNSGIENKFLHYKHVLTEDALGQTPHLLAVKQEEAEEEADEESSLRALSVDNMRKRIKEQFDLLRYVDAEPSLSRPPALPAQTLAECVELQAQAVRHLQVMFWVVKACAEDTHPHCRVRRSCEHYRAIASLLAAIAKDDVTSQSLRSDKGLRQRRLSFMSGPEEIAAVLQSSDSAVSVLLRLEQSLMEVGRYVALVVSFLTVCLRDLGQDQEVRAGRHQSPNLNTIENLSRTGDKRSAADYHKEFLSHFASAEELNKVAGNGELLAKLETQNVITLLSHFHAVLELLLREVEDSVATTVVVNGVPARTPRGNKEVLVVNTMIASSVDLVRALRGLAVVVSSLRAHRDIRLTQTGTGFF